MAYITIMTTLPVIYGRLSDCQHVRTRLSQEENFLIFLFGILTEIYQHILICLNTGLKQQLTQPMYFHAIFCEVGIEA